MPVVQLPALRPTGHEELEVVTQAERHTVHQQDAGLGDDVRYVWPLGGGEGEGRGRGGEGGNV